MDYGTTNKKTSVSNQIRGYALEKIATSCSQKKTRWDLDHLRPTRRDRRVMVDMLREFPTVQKPSLIQFLLPSLRHIKKETPEGKLG